MRNERKNVFYILYAFVFITMTLEVLRMYENIELCLYKTGKVKRKSRKAREKLSHDTEL